MPTDCAADVTVITQVFANSKRRFIFIQMEKERSLSIWRVFFPSWKFFDHPGAIPEVFIRMGERSDQLSDWRPAFRSEPRHWWNLFWNPRGTLRLLNSAAFDRLLQESQSYLKSPDRFSESVSYQLCCAILAEEWRPSIRQGFYQFKIVAALTENFEGELGDALISKIHRVGS